MTYEVKNKISSLLESGVILLSLCSCLQNNQTNESCYGPCVVREMFVETYNFLIYSLTYLFSHYFR